MIHAGKMVIPDGDAYFERVFARTGDKFQAELFKAALSYTPRRICAVDAGAHVGSWTRQLCGEFADVLAFEPHPMNFACLQENTRGLDLTRYSVALGEADGECDMVKHANNSGCWRVIPGGGVRIVPLDSFNLAAVDLIKIDVEGYEGAVIKGAARTLYECSPTVVFEDNGLGPKMYGKDWIDPKVPLTELGYRFRTRINKDEIWRR